MFEEALAAVAELLGGITGDGEGTRRELSLTAPDRAVLLADWIAELAYLAESHAFVPERIERIEVAGSALSATIAGRRGEPPHLVKAVTYHRLEFECGESGCHARVVLDV